jgi:hypothetical protein
MQQNGERAKEVRTLPTGTRASKVTEVNASPVNTYVNPGNQPNRLLQALEAVSPAVKRYQENANKEAFSAGEEAMRNLSVEEAAALVKSGELQAQSNPYYTKGAMSLYGDMKGREASRGLVAEYEQSFNRDTDNIDEFISNFVGKDTAGSQDDDYLAGYQPQMDRAVNSLRDRYSKEQTEAVKEGVRRSAYERSLEYFQSDEPPTVADLAALSADLTDFFGYSKKEAELLNYEAAVQASLSGRPEVFAPFYEKRNDGSPGLASTPEYGPKIELARQAAERKKASNVAKADQNAKFEALLYLEDKLSKGELTDVELKGYVEGGSISADKAISLSERQQKVLADLKEQAEMKVALLKGSGIDKADSPVLKKVFNDLSDDLMQEAGDDPSSKSVAMSKVISIGKQNGQQYAVWKNQFDNVTPEFPDQFKKSANLYRTLKENNASYAGKYVSDDQALVFDTYLDAMRQEGADEGQALSVAQAMSTPEAIQEAKAFMNGRASYELYEKVNSALVTGGMFGDDVKNDTFIKSRVKQLAVARLVRGGGSVDTAVQYAIDRVESNYRNLNGRMIFVGNDPSYDYEEFEEDANSALEDYVSFLGEEGNPPEPEGYYLKRDPRSLKDGTFVIMSESDDFPTGKRVDMKKVKVMQAAKRRETVKQNILQSIEDKATRKVSRATQRRTQKISNAKTRNSVPFTSNYPN